MLSDGSLSPVGNLSATTDVNGKFRIPLVPLGTNYILSAKKDITVGSTQKPLTINSVVSVTDEDVAAGKKPSVDANPVTTITVAAIKDLIITTNTGKSNSEKIDITNIPPEKIQKVQENIIAAVTADKNSSAPVVNLSNILTGNDASVKQTLTNLESKPYGQTIKTEKENIVSKSSIRVKTVLNKDGTGPFSGVEVYFTSYPKTGEVTYSCITDNKGECLFENLEPFSDYDISVRKVGYVEIKPNGKTSKAGEEEKIVVHMERTDLNQPPNAKAGLDQTVLAGALVVLDGTASYDPEKKNITYLWSQLSGASVTLSITISATTTFTPPSASVYTFQLIVNDGRWNSNPDAVAITAVVPACRANSDCNDNNPLTIDACTNAGLVNSACTHTPIACNTDSDCSSQNPFCINGGATSSICIKCKADSNCNDNNPLTIDTCTNAGTSSAVCTNTNCPIACSSNSDCKSTNIFIPNICKNPGTCNAVCASPICVSNSDCNDNNEYTLDICAMYTCSHAPIVCLSNSDCNDNNPLTIDICLKGGIGNLGVSCVHIACTSDNDCNDNNPLTTDVCNNPGTVIAACSNNACTVACSNDSVCNDNNSLTLDSCTNAGTCNAACTHTAIACNINADCAAASSTMPFCLNGGATSAVCIKCTANSDCNDNNALTFDACTNANTAQAVCSNVQIACNTAADCNDNNALTIDVCNNGGLSNASCSHTTIACNTNSDCVSVGANRVALSTRVNLVGYQSDENPVDDELYVRRYSAAVVEQQFCVNGGTFFAVCVVCKTDTDCNDNNALTLDACTNANTAQAVCSNVQIACNTAADCNDNNSSTIDACTNAGQANSACSHNNIPTVSITATPATGTAPLTVQLTASCTDTDGTCASGSWDFGDNSSITTDQFSLISSVSHTYSATGTYLAKFTAADNAGATSTFAQATITVSLAPTIAGVITDSTTHLPIADAVVKIYTTGYSDITLSNSNGEYAFYNVPSGTYFLIATKENYTLEAKTVTVP